MKVLAVSDKKRPRRILFGALRGLKLELSLKHQAQLYFGLFERELHPWMKIFSRGIRSAVDIGAAEGEYALYFLRLTGATRVYAFEPNTECVRSLQRNARFNGFTCPSERLIINQLYIGKRTSDTSISLDSLADSLERPCIIKVDVDGAEKDVLSGAKALNRLPGVRWLIETHSSELERSCLGILKDAGFECRVIPNAWWRILVPELRPIAHNRWLAAWNE